MHKITKIKKSNLIWGLLLLLFAGCGPDVVYEEYVTIPDGGWNKDSMASFHVKLDDISHYYDILIDVRNKSDYPNSNLWLFVDVTSPKGKTIRDTINLYLANEHGKWIGSGWGDLFLVQYPYRRNVKFAEPGEYKFNIIQGMRYDELEGINDIGLTIVRSEKSGTN